MPGSFSKTEQITLNKEQARRFLLGYQGLLPPKSLKTKNDILQFIRKVGCIQFDPLNILGRNPDLVLQSRVDQYQPHMLEELLYKDRQLLDGWDKMMSIYSVEDWPYFSRFREAQKNHFGHEKRPANEVMDEVRELIRKEGPLSSIDLKFDRKVDWAWGPTRISRAALESMYFWGELIVHHKVNTRRFYDFADRHLPQELLQTPDPHQTLEEYREWHIQRRTGSVGLVSSRTSDFWRDILNTKAVERNQTLQNLVNKGLLLKVKIDELPSQEFYMRSSELEELDKTKEMEISKPKISIIAALDNLTWERRMLADIFDFDYIWEVYKPVEQRKYGYYVLPVLYGDRFIARFEAKFERKRSELVFKNWWWEDNLNTSDPALQTEILSGFRHFMNYLNAESFILDEACQPGRDMDWLQGLLN